MARDPCRFRALIRTLFRTMKRCFQDFIVEPLSQPFLHFSPTIGSIPETLGDTPTASAWGVTSSSSSFLWLEITFLPYLALGLTLALLQTMLFLYGAIDSHFLRLTNGYDVSGNVCGTMNNIIPGVLYSGANMEAMPCVSLSL